MDKLISAIFSILSVSTVLAQDTCGSLSLQATSIDPRTPLTVQVTNVPQQYRDKDLYVRVYDSSNNFVSDGQAAIRIKSDGTATATVLGPALVNPGSYTVSLYTGPIQSLDDTTPACSNSVSLGVGGVAPGPLRNPVEEQKTGVSIDPTFCNNNTGIDSAIGCIPYTEINKLVAFALTRGVAIGGGVGLLTFLFGGFQIMTSAGDPKKLAVGKDFLTAGVGGILLLVFSIFFLRVIGSNLLGIF